MFRYNLASEGTKISLCTENTPLIDEESNYNNFSQKFNCYHYQIKPSFVN